MRIELSRTEQARADFIDALMAYNSAGISPHMKRVYADRAERTQQPIESIKDVGAVLEDTPIYKFAAFFERHNHAMIFQTTLDVLEKRRDEILAWLDDANAPEAVGSLELDPELSVPHYYDRIEIHTQPGSYHGNPFAGLLYHWMIGPFLLHRDDDGMGTGQRGAQKGLSPDSRYGLRYRQEHLRLL